jgi:hypothetical protein
MSIAEIRRENLKLLVEKHGSKAALARATGKAPAYIFQLISGRSNLGEAAKRDIEKVLGLERDWLDLPRQNPPHAFPPEVWQQLGPEARTLVLSVAEFSANTSQAGEAALLSAYRSCSAEGRSVVLSVAQAQAALSRNSKHK